MTSSPRDLTPHGREISRGGLLYAVCLHEHRVITGKYFLQQDSFWERPIEGGILYHSWCKSAGKHEC